MGKGIRTLENLVPLRQRRTGKYRIHHGRTRQPEIHNAHMPLGVEPGTNIHWVPGGYTEGMAPEAVVYNVKNPNVVDSDKDSNARDVTVRECKLIR